MGILVSTPINTSPFSLVSGIFGFIGFTFTLATFFKVVWQNLTTVAEAPSEVHEYLTTLRQELLEEKRSVRLMRQTCKNREHEARRRHGDRVDGLVLGSFRGIELDDVSLKTTADLVRRLIKEFKLIEQPFLADGEDGIMGEKRHARHAKDRERGRDRRSSERDRSSYYDHAAYGGKGYRGRSRPSSRSPRDSRYHSADEEDDEDRYWVQRVRYADLTLARRVKWIWYKPQASSMFGLLSKIQIRRMSQQGAGMAILMHEAGNITLDIDARLERMDERLSRLVGVRRADS